MQQRGPQCIAHIQESTRVDGGRRRIYLTSMGVVQAQDNIYIESVGAKERGMKQHRRAWLFRRVNGQGQLQTRRDETSGRAWVMTVFINTRTRLRDRLSNNAYKGCAEQCTNRAPILTDRSSSNSYPKEPCAGALQLFFFLPMHLVMVHHQSFLHPQISEDFACATLPAGRPKDPMLPFEAAAVPEP